MTVVRQVVGLNNAPNVIDYQSGGWNSRRRHQPIQTEGNHESSYGITHDECGLVLSSLQ